MAKVAYDDYRCGNTVSYSGVFAKVYAVRGAYPAKAKEYDGVPTIDLEIDATESKVTVPASDVEPILLHDVLLAERGFFPSRNTSLFGVPNEQCMTKRMGTFFIDADYIFGTPGHYRVTVKDGLGIPISVSRVIYLHELENVVNTTYLRENGINETIIK